MKKGQRPETFFLSSREGLLLLLLLQLQWGDRGKNAHISFRSQPCAYLTIYTFFSRILFFFLVHLFIHLITFGPYFFPPSFLPPSLPPSAPYLGKFGGRSTSLNLVYVYRNPPHILIDRKTNALFVMGVLNKNQPKTAKGILFNAPTTA